MRADDDYEPVVADPNLGTWLHAEAVSKRAGARYDEALAELGEEQVAKNVHELSKMLDI